MHEWRDYCSLLPDHPFIEQHARTRGDDSPFHGDLMSNCQYTVGIRPFARAAAALAGTLILSPPSLQAQGVRFTLAPSAEYAWWDSSLRLEDGPLFGARLGADFGSLLSVSGYYHRSASDLRLGRDSIRFTGAPLIGLRETNTSISTYGGNLAVRLSRGRFAPFLSGGAGIIRFEADSAVSSDQINYRYGGGFQYDPTSNIRATVMLEDSRFRLDPDALFPSTNGDATPNARRATRSNLVLSAGLGFAVGGRLDDDDDNDRWAFASVPLEAFVGRLDFDDPTIDRQALVGVRGGVDLGQYVGLRGFYWQGRSSDLSARQPLQSYGGEAQFNFNRTPSIAPFLLVGAGRLDFGRDFRDALDRPRDMETALILGAGVGVRLSDALRLNATVRDYVRGPQDLDDLSSSDQLSNNWLYSVGLGFNFGRSRTPRPSNDELSRARTRERNRASAESRERAVTREIVREELRRARMEQQIDSVIIERRVRVDSTGAVTTERRLLRDSLTMLRERMGMMEKTDSTRMQMMKRDSTGMMMRDSASMTMMRERTNARDTVRDARVIMLPVPVEGELYVRYGSGASQLLRATGGRVDSVRTAAPADSLHAVLRARIDSLEAALSGRPPAVTPRPAPRAAVPPVAAAPVRDPVLEAENRALRERLDDLETRMRESLRRQEELARRPLSPANPPSVVVIPGGAERNAVVAGGDTTRRAVVNIVQEPGFRVTKVSPYLAGFGQFVIGSQFDAGPLFGVPQLRLVPDFAVGLSSGASISLAVGGQYDFRPLRFEAPGSYQPHVRAGLGFVAASGTRDSEFGVTLAYGVTFAPPGTDPNGTRELRRPLIFLEHQGINFFSTNRFLLGVRYRTP